MKIHLPNSAFLGNIDPFLGSFDTSEKDTLEITFNKKWVSVHPVVLSMVAALGLSMHDSSKIKIEQMEAKSKYYFERMGLFTLLGHKSGICLTEHESAGRFIPLTQIKDSKQLDNFIKEMIPLLHQDPSRVDTIRYVISELVRNVFEHSYSPHGAIVCAQFHKKSNTFRIGVADTGKGIKKSINVSYAAKEDIDAIKLALTPGVTGTTRSRTGTELNAGAGLFFIKSIAKVNRDFFMIYSGDAMYKLLKTRSGSRVSLNINPFKDNCSKKKDLPYWKGTVVGIDISLDRHQDFEYLLSLIRKVYQKDYAEKKKKRIKKVRFI